MSYIGLAILWPTVFAAYGVSLGVDDTSLWLHHPSDGCFDLGAEV